MIKISKTESLQDLRLDFYDQTFNSEDHIDFYFNVNDHVRDRIGCQRGSLTRLNLRAS